MSIKGNVRTAAGPPRGNSRICRPKCGGAVYVHEEDRGPAITQAVMAAIAMIALAAIMVAVGGAKW